MTFRYKSYLRNTPVKQMGHSGMGLTLPLIPYLSGDTTVPYWWTFGPPRGAAGQIINKGSGSSDAFLFPAGATSPAYSSVGGLDGDYVTAETNGAAGRFFTSNGGLPEMYSVSADLANPFTMVFVFKPTKTNTGTGLMGYTPSGSFNQPAFVSLSYSAGSQTACSVNNGGGIVALTGMVWNTWNVLFFNYTGVSTNAALNLGPSVATSGGGLAGADPGQAIRLLMTKDAAHYNPFDDAIDTVALYANVDHSNNVWNLDRPQIYARIMAKQPLYTFPGTVTPVVTAGSGGWTFDGATETTDPYYANVVFLGHMDTTGFVDVTGRHTPSTITGVSSVAGLFDNAVGLSADGNKLLYTGNDGDFSFAGDFTVEVTCKGDRAALADGYGNLVGVYGATGGGNGPGQWLFRADPTGAGFFVEALGGYALHDTFVPLASDVVRYSITKSGSNGYLHRSVNGGVFNLVDSTASMPTCNATSKPFAIGCYDGIPIETFVGWIDEVRITKGIARYTSASYAPTAGPFLGA